MMIPIFWDLTPPSLGNRSQKFKGNTMLHFQWHTLRKPLPFRLKESPNIVKALDFVTVVQRFEETNAFTFNVPPRSRKIFDQ